jgi:hypothetical protein
MVHFGFFRRTHPASIHPFDTAEDRRFTATLAPGPDQWTFRVGCVSACRVPHADCVTRPAVLKSLLHCAYCLRKALGDGDSRQLH